MESFLQKGEPAAVRVVKNSGGVGVVTCEHASNRVPKVLQKTFGVSQADLDDHIGWDIGAEVLALRVAKGLGMPAVIPAYSRLVVDLNRGVRQVSLMPQMSDPVARGRIEIPGNIGLTAAARRARLAALYHPYRAAVQGQIDAFVLKKQKPLVLSIHSFTPKMGGKARPWEIGVLWDRDAKTAKRLMRHLREQNPQLTIGDNQPYSMSEGRMKGAVVVDHGAAQGLPHVLIEVRNDLIDTPAKARRWGDVLARALG